MGGNYNLTIRPIHDKILVSDQCGAVLFSAIANGEMTPNKYALLGKQPRVELRGHKSRHLVRQPLATRFDAGLFSLWKKKQLKSGNQFLTLMAMR